jgi:hypothetical protein
MFLPIISKFKNIRPSSFSNIYIFSSTFLSFGSVYYFLNKDIIYNNCVFDDFNIEYNEIQK